MSVRVHQARYVARCAACATPFVALLWSSPAMSQSASQCVDSISSGALTRGAVYLDVSASPDASRAFGTQLMFYAEIVAKRLRADFHMRGDTLGEGEPAVMWRDVGKYVAMTVFPNGEMRGAIEGNGGEYDRTAATEMLLREALAARDDGDRIPWPSGAEGDSLRFILNLLLPLPDTLGKMAQPRPTIANFPVFSVLAPRERPVDVLPGNGTPHYPDRAKAARVVDQVVLTFVVDTSGRAEMGTIEEVQPADAWHTGEPYHRLFVESVRAWLPRTRYAPASIGGCLRRQRVQTPYIFCMPGVKCAPSPR